MVLFLGPIRLTYAVSKVNVCLRLAVEIALEASLLREGGRLASLIEALNISRV